MAVGRWRLDGCAAVDTHVAFGVGDKIPRDGDLVQLPRPWFILMLWTEAQGAGREHVEADVSHRYTPGGYKGVIGVPFSRREGLREPGAGSGSG